MKIGHVALYTYNLERLKGFYAGYFGGIPGDGYHNPRTGLSTCFVRFDNGPALELMTLSGGLRKAERGDVQTGYNHVAFSLQDRDAVDALTQRLKDGGFEVVSGPRMTGDGYYESCVLDPDGNRVEITCE